MTRRQYQFVSLAIVIGSLLLVTVVSQLVSAFLPGEPVTQDGTPPPEPVTEAARTDPPVSPPAPQPDPSSGNIPQNPVQSSGTDPASMMLNTQPTLDTNGVQVSGTDPVSSFGGDGSGASDAAAQPQGDQATVQPPPS